MPHESRKSTPVLYGISAEPRHGKTSAACEMAEALKKQGVTISGVAQPAILEWIEGNPVVLGYRLLDLENQVSVPFAKKVEPGAGEIGGMRFCLAEAGISWAAERIARPASVLFVDELGWVEAKGGGHFPALQETLVKKSHEVIIVAFRPSLEEIFGEKLRPWTGGFREIWVPGSTPKRRYKSQWVSQVMRDLNHTEHQPKNS